MTLVHQRSLSDDIWSPYDTIVGAKPRARSQKRDSTIYYYLDPKSEEQDTDYEENTTTSNTESPTIDLTSVEMSECYIDEKPPSQNQCDINENPLSLKTMDMTNVDMSSSKSDDITSNNGNVELVDFNTAKLLSRINEIIICPISRIEIKDSLCGPNKLTYERERIEKWLQKHFLSNNKTTYETIRYGQ